MNRTVTAAFRQPNVTMAVVVLGTALSALVGTNSGGVTADQTLTDISRYCAACWRNARLAPDLWTDCTQEVFVRLLERVPRERWSLALGADGEERRELVRAIDMVKKRVQRGKKWTALAGDVCDPRLEPDVQRAEIRDVLTQSAAAILSDKQQRIVCLSLEGWAVPEIARELNTTPERISDEKYKALGKLRRHLQLET